MHTITVVSLGPGSPDLLTLGALKQLKAARQVILRTARHGAVPLLRAEGVGFTSLDTLYDQSPDFDAFAALAAGRVLSLAEKSAVTYAVTDPAGDVTVRLLREKAGESVNILPGVGLASQFMNQALPELPILLSSAVGLRVVNAQQPLCVFELNSKALAGEVKLKLLPKYGDGAILYFFPPSEAQRRKRVRLTLSELDRQPRYDHTTGFVLLPQPLLARGQFDPEDLLQIMRVLRAGDGCPWDREQTHQSLAKYLVEEANEAACALLEEDWEEAADELGDVFLQLAFHAVIGEEYATFTWEEMLQAICRKLIRRHPHVFGSVQLETADEVLANWDQIKKAERGGKGTGERMSEVPRGLAPMLRAEKVQKLAAKVGFDWPEPLGALDKVLEEAEELRQALARKEDAEDELGDLLFSCVNVARLLRLSADQALHFASEKFIRRFNYVEKSIKNDKKDWNLLTSNEIGVYWERSKAMVNKALRAPKKKEDIT